MLWIPDIHSVCSQSSPSCFWYTSERSSLNQKGKRKIKSTENSARQMLQCTRSAIETKIKKKIMNFRHENEGSSHVLIIAIF